MKAVRTETELDSQHSRWQERFYNEDPWTFEHSFTPGQIRENRRRIDFLREELDLLGPVDVEAIQEYAEVQQRFDFLNQQNLDLIAARDSLQLLLRETEKIMARDFDTFFVQANESFGKTFQEIFSGGEARLEMLETDDRLSAGVDIVVKMPGKKSQSLNLLSGGERALTCIAFIFSLLRLKPAPFCLLDEIDASLDETNLLRFTRFLKDMAHDTQFIVITHRQAIIEAGEIIYGVTMPQEGISAIFSLNVGEAETMAG
jgi:chromosome segregation protein